MAKQKSNGSVLLELYNNKALVSKVDVALEEGKSYDYIIELCKKYKFDISKSAISRYKDKRKEAIETGVDLADLLDKRRKTGNIVDIQTKEVAVNNEATGVFDKVDTVYSDIEVLDSIIQKGKNGLDLLETVDIPQVLRAMEVKDRITGNQMQGLSIVGLKQLRLRAIAKESAMTEVILRYIPEDEQELVLEELKQAEQEFYDNLDLSEEDQRVTKALRTAGIEF